MTAKLLEGTDLASSIRKEVKDVVEGYRNDGYRPPSLNVVLIGNDPASKIYVGQKQKACKEVGIESKVYELPLDISQVELNNLIASLNQDDNVDGILLQLPIPTHLSRAQSLDMIIPSKDVDGLTSFNQGAVLTQNSGLYPCTPLGIMELLNKHVNLHGKKVALIGYSLLVGAPLSTMLVHAGATVTVITRTSVDAPSFTKQADIVIAAAGRRHLVNHAWLKQGAVVVDVGIHRNEKSISGDVDFEDVKSVASAISPVPGGVGPLTVAFLIKNCLFAYQKKIP